MSKTTETLAAGWAARARRAATDGQAALNAPALFKPGWLEGAITQHHRAQRWVTYWLGIGGA